MLYIISMIIIVYCCSIEHGYTELPNSKRIFKILTILTWHSFAVSVLKVTGYWGEYLILSSLIVIWMTVIRCGIAWARGDTFYALLWEKSQPYEYVGEIKIGPPDITDWHVVTYKRWLLPSTYVYTSIKQYPPIITNIKQHD